MNPWQGKKCAKHDFFFLDFPFFKDSPGCPGLPEYMKIHDKLKEKEPRWLGYATGGIFLARLVPLQHASPPSSAILHNYKENGSTL